jgi:hypothetical protein
MGRGKFLPEISYLLISYNWSDLNHRAGRVPIECCYASFLTLDVEARSVALQSEPGPELEASMVITCGEGAQDGSGRFSH